jgi:hypothetical protein
LKAKFGELRERDQQQQRQRRVLAARKEIETNERGGISKILPPAIRFRVVAELRIAINPGFPSLQGRTQKTALVLQDTSSVFIEKWNS